MLFCNLEKSNCSFFKFLYVSLLYLYFVLVVGKEQVQMETDKVKAVKEWKTPIKVKKVESFLGFANFYR